MQTLLLFYSDRLRAIGGAPCAQPRLTPAAPVELLLLIVQRCAALTLCTIAQSTTVLIVVRVFLRFRQVHKTQIVRYCDEISSEFFYCFKTTFITY